MMPTTFAAVYAFEWDSGREDWWIDSTDESILEIYGKFEGVEIPPGRVGVRFLRVRAGDRWARVTLHPDDPSALVAAHADTVADATEFATILATHLSDAAGLAWTMLDLSEVDRQTVGLLYRQRAVTHPPAPNGTLDDQQVTVVCGLLDGPLVLTPTQVVSMATAARA